MESSELSTKRLLSLLNRASKEELSEFFERHGVDNASDLVAEIRRDGSNSLTTWIFRFGEGVNYDEVVMDVASKVGVKYDSAEVADETELELLIVQDLVRKHFDSLSPEERAEFEKHLKQLGEEYTDFWRQFSEATGAALFAIVQRLGPRLIGQLLAPIMVRLLAVRGVAVVAPRLLGLAVPFLNVAMAVWLVIDIAGPAYRKTVPTVFQVALLRLQYAR